MTPGPWYLVKDAEEGTMSWFKDKQLGKEVAVSSEHGTAGHHHTPHVAHEVEDRLAHCLITHQRLQARTGRPLMLLLGVQKNAHDGTIDYSVRSRVHDEQGKDRRFDSTIRVYPTGHLRLVR
jgi:hypothetical protein